MELVDVVPTVLDYVGVAVPENVQGRSLRGVIEGKTEKHRERVFIEYSENEEGYVVTERWKLIYGTGARAREDGYETGNASAGRLVRLYDLREDPGEMRDVSAREPKVVEALVAALAEQMARTAREAGVLPKSDDPHVVLAECLKPRDVTREEAVG